MRIDEDWYASLEVGSRVSIHIHGPRIPRRFVVSFSARRRRQKVRRSRVSLIRAATASGPQ